MKTCYSIKSERIGANNMEIKRPKYQIIAEDIASKIVEKKYVIGEKIYARSTLASNYGVSAETARRAIAVLQDLNIVEATKGSGVVITSYEKAAQFMHQLSNVKSVREIQRDVKAHIEAQYNELRKLEQATNELVERTERYQSINPFVPFQLEITPQCPYVTKSLGEINFWHQTRATIVGIKKDEALILSPGPYATLDVGNVIYFIGEESCLDVVKHFLQL